MFVIYRVFLVCTVLLGLIAPAAPAQTDTARTDSAHVLEPVVVTVARTPDTRRRVPAAVTVLTGDRIAQGRPGLSLSEALGTVPGVSIQNRFNASRDEAIAIRGFGARAAFGIRGVRILLDGIPQTLPDGQGQLTSIDLTTVDRIEVLRGGASALYGNAAGGVITLRSRTDPVARVVPETRITVGDFGTTAFHAGAHAPVGRGSAALRVSRSETDGFRALAEAETWRASLRVAQPVGTRTELLATAHLTEQPRLGDPGALNAQELETDFTVANPGFATVNAGKDLFQLLGGLAARHRVGGAGELEVAVFGSRRDLVNTLPFAEIDLDRWTWGARSTVTAPLPELPLIPMLTAGIDAQWQRDDRIHTAPSDGRVTRDQEERVREVGPFVQLRVHPDPMLAVTAGARYDAITFRTTDRLSADGDQSGDRTMSQASWSVGATLDAHALAAPYASVGTSFETPTTTELVNTPDGSAGFNPSLAPQHATHYEVGLRGGTARFRYDVAAYQADVTDALIPFEDPAVEGRTFFRNAGSARHRGLEMALEGRPWPWLTLRVAWTEADHEFRDFRRGDDVFDGNAIPGVPGRFVSATVRAGGARGVWVLAETRASGSVAVDDANAARTDPWWIADVRLGYRWFWWAGRVDLWAGLENVFDERYVSAVAVNANFGRFYEPGRPRMLLVGMELR